jgi:protein-S-isoprenylcysteine O-methyltransferase Ste14
MLLRMAVRGAVRGAIRNAPPPKKRVSALAVSAVVFGAGWPAMVWVNDPHIAWPAEIAWLLFLAFVVMWVLSLRMRRVQPRRKPEPDAIPIEKVTRRVVRDGRRSGS